MCFFIMKISEIIECFNRSIDMQKGHLVLHISITSNSIFKVYKDIEYSLWFISKDKHKNSIALTESYKEKMPDVDKERILNETDKRFVVTLFKWIAEKEYLKFTE